MAHTNPADARTQKARGVLILQSAGFINGVKLIQRDADVDALPLVFSTDTQFFARPCPLRPRHGFVDSRIVKTRADVAQVWRESQAADAECELLLMPYVPAAYSAVLTPNAVAVGLGHDGATSGRNGTVTLPLALVDVSAFSPTSAGVKNTPYVEAVVDGQGRISVVQVRDGLKPPSALSGNYLPHDVTVTKILTARAGDDLLAWEKICQQSHDVGTVVHHPAGNFLSHYFLHASLHNLPVFFDADAPAVGSTHAKTSKNAPVDIAAVRRGIQTGLTCKVRCDNNQFEPLMRAVFFGTHQSFALKSTAAGAQVIGIAAALFVRFGSAACLGELRHARRDANRGLHRTQVYDNAFRDYGSARMELRRAHKKFATGRWRSAFGGKPWADCTLNTIKLDRALYDVCNSGTQESVTRLMAQLNINVNLAHNGGWWLNKFVNKSIMDSQARGTGVEILRAAFDLMPLLETAASTAPAEFQKAVAVPQPPARNLQMRVRSDSIVIQYGNRHEVKQTSFLADEKQRANIKHFLDALCPKQFKSFGDVSGAAYYRPNLSFLAAFEIVESKLFSHVTEFIKSIN